MKNHDVLLILLLGSLMVLHVCDTELATCRQSSVTYPLNFIIVNRMRYCVTN